MVTGPVNGYVSGGEPACMAPSRRAVLAGAAGATASALAGCSGGDDADGFEDHAASDGVETQPTLGALDRPGVVVAFEDPSCVSCRRFETETFPRLREELVDPGDVAFVYRTLDITFEWARPAAQLMASTYAADESAFWGLKAFYYDRQEAFRDADVFEATAPYLREAPVDAEAVLAAARAEEHDDLIARNREAADALGVSSTPQFYLFRDGEFRTEVSGPQDYDVFAGALGYA